MQIITETLGRAHALSLQGEAFFNDAEQLLAPGLHSKEMSWHPVRRLPSLNWCISPTLPYLRRQLCARISIHCLALAGGRPACARQRLDFGQLRATRCARLGGPIQERLKSQGQPDFLLRPDSL